MVSGASFDLTMSVYFGWCRLSMSADDAVLDIRTHYFHDGLAEIMTRVLRLAEGSVVESTRWPYEIAGGHFIDFSVDPENTVHIAVSEFAFGTEASDADEVWSARRGAAAFESHVPLRDFVGAFVEAVRGMRREHADDSEMRIHWPHPFPSQLFDELERYAAT